MEAKNIERISPSHKYLENKLSQLQLSDSKSDCPNYSGNKQSKSDSKGLTEEEREIIEADAEFNALMNTPDVVLPAIAPSKLAKNFVNGFKIVSMCMKDAHIGKTIWKNSDWNTSEMFTKELIEHIPKSILECRAVSREITFYSAEEIKNFRLIQRVYLNGKCIEEWFFKFGYVIPGSQNTWEQTIEAAPANEMIPADQLSGKIVFETSFYDDDDLLCKNSMRIYYV